MYPDFNTIQKEAIIMNSNSKKLNIYLVAMSVLTAVAVTLRSIACITDLDYKTGLFDSSINKAADIIMWITVILMLTYGFTATKISIKSSFSTPLTYVPSGMLGAAILFLGVKMLSYAINTGRYPLISAGMLKNEPLRLFAVIIFILSLASVAHLFLNSFYAEQNTDLRAYCALGTVVFMALYAMAIYFDSTLPIIDSGKIINQTAFLFSAVFLLYEARISLGREMWRAYGAFGLAASALTAYASVPAILTYYVNGVLLSSAKGSIRSLEEYIVLLALFVYITARLCVHASIKGKTESKLLSAMDEYARLRAIRVNESYERYREDFAAKQLSFFDLDKENEAEGAERCEENNESEEANKEKIPTLSDDAIYESIFGTMPTKKEEEAEAVTMDEPEEDLLTPEEHADELLNTVDAIMAEEKQDKEEDI